MSSAGRTRARRARSARPSPWTAGRRRADALGGGRHRGCPEWRPSAGRHGLRSSAARLAPATGRAASARCRAGCGPRRARPRRRRARGESSSRSPSARPRARSPAARPRVGAAGQVAPTSTRPPIRAARPGSRVRPAARSRRARRCRTSDRGARPASASRPCASRTAGSGSGAARRCARRGAAAARRGWGEARAGLEDHHGPDVHVGRLVCLLEFQERRIQRGEPFAGHWWKCSSMAALPASASGTYPARGEVRKGARSVGRPAGGVRFRACELSPPHPSPAARVSLYDCGRERPAGL